MEYVWGVWEVCVGCGVVWGVGWGVLGGVVWDMCGVWCGMCVWGGCVEYVWDVWGDHSGNVDDSS